MSTWTNGGPSGSSGSEFVHVDGDRHAGASTSGAPDKSGNGKERDQKAKSSLSSQRGRNSNGSTSSSGSNSTNWQSIINRLTDQTMPEDQAAIRKLGEDVRKAGAGGAQAAVNALRTRMTDRNATPEIRMRSISVARVLAQRITSGVDAQRQIAAPPFVNALRSISSDPNVRASLKTWASQIRIGDPSDASELAPITGLDEHLASVSDAAPQPARRPPANTPGTASFQGRPQLATTEEVDEDFREGLPIRNTNSSLFSAPIPGGFGLDGSTFDANSSVNGGPTGSVREFLPSSIQGIPPHLTIPQLGVGGVGGAHPVPVPAPGSGSAWGEDEDGVQSDAPSARSRHTAKSKSQAAQPPFGVPPSMDGGRDARSRLSHRTPRHERSGSTLASSLIDGTLSEPESLHTPAQDPMVYARHHGAGIPVPGPMPGVAPQVMPQPHQRSTSPDPVRAPRHRSPSPVSATRSRMTSRVRAQSRRRPAPAAKDPAAMLIELTGVQFVRARQDYDALREDELSLNEGDVLAVIKREADGRYWLGHIQGQVGRFPVHVVEVLSHQARPQGDSTAQEEKTAELLRRAREIEDFMEHLHDFDITRQCITEDDDIQTDLASLLDLRREVVRHLDETTTGIGRLKAMLNQIKQAQRVHDRMIDSRIAGYAARTAIHDETPRMNYQDLPSNMGYQYAAPPFDISPYTRRTGGPAPQQIEQAPARASITQRGYSDQRGYNDPAAALRYRQAQEMAYPPRVGPSGVIPPRTRTYSYAPASTPTTQRSPDDSIYTTEPSTPGELLTAGATNGQPTPSNGRFPFPVSAQHGATQNGVTWGDGERTGTVKDEVEHATRSGRARGGSHNASETSAHTHTSRRGAF